MKKIFYFAAMASMAAMALVSCDKEKPGSGNNEGDDPVVEGTLSAPVLSVSDETSSSFTISWEAVENAVSYVYVLDEGQENPTSQLSATFENMMPNTEYTVKVKACASGWEDSEWASISVTLELGDDWFSVSDPYLLDDPGATRYDMIAFDIKGKDVTSCAFGVIEASVAEGLTDDQLTDENAGYLGWVLNDSGLQSLNETGSLQGLGINGLQPETEYIVAAYATHVSGITKLVRTASVTTEAMPPMTDELKAWIGTYTVTSTQQIEMGVDADNYVTLNTVNEPMTFEISISEYNPMNLCIYGWSALDGDGYPAMASLDADGSSLDMLSQVQFEGGMLWLPLCENEGTITFVTGCEYMFKFTNNGGNITSSAYTSELSDGSSFTVVAADVFGLSGNSVSIMHDIPSYLPAGEFTLTKTSDNVPQRMILRTDRNREIGVPVKAKAVAAR